MNPVIEATQVTKTYDGQTVIHSIDLSVTEGSIHAIAGPNGAGKSTFLKMLAGLIQPTTGTIRIFAHSIQDGTSLRQRVHYISPEVHLYPFFQVKDILKYASLLYERWDPERCKLLIDAFGLPVNKTVRQLSLGMKMRLRIVVALSARADVLLLDEATNGIDPAGKEQILDLVLQESANRGVTVVMATHQLAEIERVADTVSVLIGGRIVSSNPLDDLKEHVHEVHATIPARNGQTLEPLPGLLDYTAYGERFQLIWTGTREDIYRRLRELGATSVDMLPAGLDRWFLAMSNKEGVQNGKIVLPEGTAL